MFRDVRVTFTRYLSLSQKKGYSMAYSHNAPFRADVVGSYLRPAELKAAREDFAAGKIDAAALKAVEDKAITELVAKQKPPACM